MINQETLAAIARKIAIDALSEKAKPMERIAAYKALADATTDIDRTPEETAVQNALEQLRQELLFDSDYLDALRNQATNTTARDG